MMHPSTKKLIDRLAEMTRQRRITWEETETGIAYPTEGYRVALTRDPQTVQVTDNQGRPLEEITAEQIAQTQSETGQGYVQIVEELYREGARLARGTERAIEALLAGLEPPADTPAPQASWQTGLMPHTTGAPADAYEDVADEAGAIDDVYAEAGAPAFEDTSAEPDSASQVSDAVAAMAEQVNTASAAANPVTQVAEPARRSSFASFGMGFGGYGFGQPVPAPVQQAPAGPASAATPQPDPASFQTEPQAEPQPEATVDGAAPSYWAEPSVQPGETTAARYSMDTATGYVAPPDNSDGIEASRSENTMPPGWPSEAAARPTVGAYEREAQAVLATEPAPSPGWSPAPAEPETTGATASGHGWSEVQTAADRIETKQAAADPEPQATPSIWGRPEPTPAFQATPVTPAPAPETGLVHEPEPLYTEAAAQPTVPQPAGDPMQMLDEATRGFTAGTATGYDRAVETLHPRTEELTRQAGTGLDRFGQVAGPAVGSVHATLSGTVEEAGHAASSAAEATFAAAGQAGQGVAQAAQGAASSLYGGLGGAASSIGQAVSGISTKLTEPQRPAHAPEPAPIEESEPPKPKPVTRFNPWS